jgi:hypothetical protein
MFCLPKLVLNPVTNSGRGDVKMNDRKHLSARSVLIGLTLTILATPAGYALKGSFTSAMKAALVQMGVAPIEPQTASGFKVTKLSKKAKTDKAGAAPSVMIRLNGLKPTDYVNLRPSHKLEVEVTAGSMVPKSESKDGLPESALNVTANEVTFTRPQSISETIVLDIELPSGTQTQAVVDGNVVLNGSFQQPLSVQGQEVRPGETTFAAALLRTQMPDEFRGLAVDAVDKSDRRMLGDDKLFVHVSKLKVLKTVAFDTDSPLNRAALEINEEGKVVKVIPLSKKHDQGLEDALLQWEFAPYMVDGHPVPILTVLSPISKAGKD